MLAALVSFIVFVIIVVIVAAIALWAVQKFFPEVYAPARLIVGGCALIAILLKLLGVLNSGGLGL